MNKFFKAFVLVLGLCLLICGVALADETIYDSLPGGSWKELKNLEVPSTCYSNGYKVFENNHWPFNQIMVRQPKVDHSKDWKVVEYPDCTKQGKAELRCKWCRNLIHWDKDQEHYVIVATPDTKPLEKLSHNTYNNPKNYKIPATCQKEGEKHEFCLTCGEDLITVLEIDKNAHAFGADRPVKKETCTEDGLYVRICGLCGYSQTVPAVDEKGEKTHPALGHDISLDEAEANFWNYPNQIRVSYHQDATCMADGMTINELFCLRCNERITSKTVIIQKLPHNLKEDTIERIFEPTCYREGKARGTCTVCGNPFAELTIAKLPHNLVKKYIAHDPSKCDVEEKHNSKPTCLEGADYYWYCKNDGCGDLDKDGNKVTSPWQEIAIYHQAALDHDWSAWETSIEASKDSLGLQIRFCNRCQWINKQSFTTKPTCTEGQTIYDFIYEDDGTTLVSKEEIVKDPVPHTEVVDPAVEATYDHPGKTSGSHCEVCGAIIKEQQFIPQKTYATTKYTLSDVKYDGSAITGKVVHVENTGKVDTLFVRIVVFMADGTYMITVAPVADDMTFEIGASGDFDFAGLVVTGTMKSIAPGSYDTYGEMGFEF